MMDRLKLGIILFILSEATFFVFLVFAYVYYHQSGGQGPTAANSLDTFKTGLFSLALFLSSATVWRAGAGLKHGHRTRAWLWLLLTIVLGLVFLAGQALEYDHLLRNNVTISRNLFGSTFFTLTSFHALHVFVGLTMLSILFGLTVAANRREPTLPAVEGIALYWHFVDGVWVVIFSVVYLWKYL